MFKVYVKTNERGCVIACDGGYTTPDDLENWILIDEGVGDRFALCQQNYFAKGIKNNEEIPIYKLVNVTPVQRSDAEIAAELAEIQAAQPPTEPAPIEALQSENNLLKAQIQAQSERNDFMEDCIAEMAGQIYA